jgi:hypothetical protein
MSANSFADENNLSIWSTGMIKLLLSKNFIKEFVKLPLLKNLLSTQTEDDKQL